MTSVYQLDETELAALRDEALAVALDNCRELAVSTTETTIVTPSLTVKAVLTLESLSNYERLKRAHTTAVAG